MLRLFTLLLCTWSSTSLGQSYDLRAIEASSDIHRQGESYRVLDQKEMSQKMTLSEGDQVLGEQDQSTGEIDEHRVQVQAVDATGRPTNMTWTYERWGPIGEGIAPLDVEGITVQIERAEDGSYSYTHISGPEIVGPLKSQLAKEMTELGADPKVNREKMEIILPAGPVGVGETWTIDVPAMMNSGDFPVFGMKDSGSGLGRLEEMILVEGHETLNLSIEITFPISDMAGTPCIDECLFRLAMDIHTPVDGDHSRVRRNMTMAVTGLFGSPVSGDLVQTRIDLSMTGQKTTEPVR